MQCETARERGLGSRKREEKHLVVVIRSGPNLIGAGCSEIKRARELHLRDGGCRFESPRRSQDGSPVCVCVCTLQPRIIHAHHHSHTRPHARSLLCAGRRHRVARGVRERRAVCGDVCEGEMCVECARGGGARTPWRAPQPQTRAASPAAWRRHSACVARCGFRPSPDSPLL